DGAIHRDVLHQHRRGRHDQHPDRHADADRADHHHHHAREQFQHQQRPVVPCAPSRSMSRRHLLACLLIACAGVRPARALLTFANPNPWAPPDQVIVTATYGRGYDTNVFTRTVAHGAVTQVVTAGAPYTRRAGVISLTAATSM